MTKKEKAAALAAYAADQRKTHHTQFYGFLKPTRKGEVEVKVFAVSDTKTYGLRVKEVNRAWSDRPYYQSKDVWKNVWGTWMVEWDEEKNRPQESHQWYRGKWGSEELWENGSKWFAKYVRHVNLEALAGTRFRYCGFADYARHAPEDNALPLVQYLQLWEKFHGVEMLARMGFHRFITPYFVDRLAKSPALVQWFKTHAREIAETWAGPQIIMRAFKQGVTVREAMEEAAIVREIGRWAIGIDQKRLAVYLQKKDIDRADYRAYCQDRIALGQDPAAYAFPRDFHAARPEVHAALAEQRKDAEGRREARLAREVARIAAKVEEIGSLLDKARRRLGARIGDFTVFVPKSRRDFEAEGRAMHNCIATYFERCAKRETVCFFIRHADGGRLADVEMTPGGTIRQCRGPHNGKPSEAVRMFAEMVGKKIAGALRA